MGNDHNLENNYNYKLENNRMPGKFFFVFICYENFHRLCDSFGNKCFYETMNLNGNATISCSQCEYDCNKTTYTTSFVIRPIDPETFCTDEVNYPIVDIKKYIDLRPLFKNNPKLFYLEWKALIDGKKYRYSNEEHCKWKAKNDFAIVNIHLSTPTIPRMKQDVKHKLYDKLSILGITQLMPNLCDQYLIQFNFQLKFNNDQHFDLPVKIYFRWCTIIDLWSQHVKLF